MISLKELNEKGSIDVDDHITFRTHADVLRLFGKDVKIFQKAFAKHPYETGVHIWFPMFYDDDNNDWINTSTAEGDKVFEFRKFNNEGYLSELFESPENHKRILFAKIASFGRIFYQFKGVYEFDPELSRKAKKAAYSRTARSAKVYMEENG
jgi:hypothetical protein